MAKKPNKTRRPAKDRPEPALRLQWIEAGSLSANPANWRRHPDRQVAALGAALADPEVGWAGVLLYNERTKRLIDGHARRDLAIERHGPATPVPVLVGSWSEAGERKILTSLDPIGALAEIDESALLALLAEVDWSDHALRQMGDELLAGMDKGDTEGDAGKGDDAAGDDDASGGRAAPDAAGQTMYQVLVPCDDETQQREVFDLLKKAAYQPRVQTLN